MFWCVVGVRGDGSVMDEAKQKTTGDERPRDDAKSRSASRREVMRKAAYVAPVVLLFRAKHAVAASGSNLTGP
mgnify:CR=1 FL=1